MTFETKIKDIANCDRKSNMNFVNSFKQSFGTVLGIGKKFLIPLFFGLVVVSIICGFLPGLSKFLQ